MHQMDKVMQSPKSAYANPPMLRESIPDAQPSEVQEAVASLVRATDNLRNRLQAMEVRLGAVLSEPVPTPMIGEKVRQPSCQLASSLSNIDGQIRGLSEQVESMLSRLGL